VRIFTVLLLFVGLLSLLNASDTAIFKKGPTPLHKNYTIRPHLVEPVQSINLKDSPLAMVNASYPQRILKVSGNTAKALVDSSRNGYGWLNSSIRSIDYFSGPDAFGSPADFLVLAYRQYIVANPSSGIIGATTVDVSNGLANGTFYRHVELNQDLYSGTLGGRYPGAVALDRPFIHFNQYISGDANTTPAVSSPYTITDYGTYGAAGGAWTPSEKMDVGYTHHDSPGGNRLWNGPAAIVKDAAGNYRYGGVYANWFLSSQNIKNDHAILTASSSDPGSGWTINTNPVLINPYNFTFVSPGISMNSSGFGVVAASGHAGYHEGTSYFYEELRIVLMTTNDFGVTWSEARQVEWNELGLPTQITEADSFFYYIDDTTIAQYVGRAFLGTNFDMDVLVSEDNEIYIGFNVLWGRPADQGWYPNWRHCGPHVAVSRDGGASFTAHRIAINNGFFEGDSIIPGMPANFFESEIDLALDEEGNLYAAWVDRPNNPVELAEKPRYGTGNPDYKTDIFAARSKDGGVTWGDWINVTNTVSEDEYQLKMAKNANSRNNGTVYVAYSLVDPKSQPFQGGDDNYTDRVNRVWVAEASDFPGVVGLEREGGVLKPDGFVLHQNYPNPFNPTTTIRYSLGGPLSGQLPAISNVELGIYNLLGQRVTTLVSAKQQTGSYTVQWDASGMSSGVYFYKLTTDQGFTQTKKLVLLR